MRFTLVFWLFFQEHALTCATREHSLARIGGIQAILPLMAIPARIHELVRLSLAVHSIIIGRVGTAILAITIYNGARIVQILYLVSFSFLLGIRER